MSKENKKILAINKPISELTESEVNDIINELVENGSLSKDELVVDKREKFIDIKKVSKYLNINDRTIYSWVQKGMIPHYRIGGSRGMVRFDYATIDKWMDSKKNGYIVTHSDYVEEV